MADPGPDGSLRLDSWKAIAAYLNRDERTVRRWERQLGLPVRRVGEGRGYSVFAYSGEIDAWLKVREAESAPNAPPSAPAGSQGPAHGAAAPGQTRTRSLVKRFAVAAAALTLLSAAGLLWRVGVLRAVPRELRLEASPRGIDAFDARGRQLWTYPFPTDYQTMLLDEGAARVNAGSPSDVYVATSYRIRLSDRVPEGGTLSRLDMSGNLRDLVLPLQDEVTYGGKPYGPPWALTSFDLDDSSGSRRIALAAHHLIWDPGLVTVFDGGTRRGTFFHAGWVSSVSWLAADRLLIGGFSNAQDGGMVALLDPDALDGQGTEPQGSAYACGTCGTDAPIRMVVMPRSEVNLAGASPFNRAIIQRLPDRILARTIEAPSSGHGAADALYEFTPSLELIRASFSDHYWEVHRALEIDGRLNHTREDCPDRNGPRAIRVWTPERTWTTEAISSHAKNSS